nr:putative metallopeptidase [Sinorhizobium medicae]
MDKGDFPRSFVAAPHRGARSPCTCRDLGFVPDFIITLDAEYCRACGDAEFMGLVKHGLYHAA